MQLIEKTPPITAANQPAVDISQLEYIAFSGQHDLVHGIYRSIPREDRRRYTSKYVLSEVIVGGVKKLRKFLAVSAEEAANDEKSFIDQTLKQFIQSCRNGRIYPRELFQSILLWADELVKLSLLNEAVCYYEEALQLGAGKYPDLQARLLIDRASVLNTLGEFPQAQTLLASLAERPYVITDRNLIPELMFNLGRESLLKGDIEYYKELLFRGLRHFYANIDDRRMFVDQICKTYRRFYRVVLSRSVSPADKILFVLHWMYFKMSGVRLLNGTRLTSLVRLVVLGYVYAVNYVRIGTAVRAPQPVNGSVSPFARSSNGNGQRVAPRPRTIRNNILLTRAMGGIGDLLMMTPGLHALSRKYPREEIHFAIPRRYFPLFEGNQDVTLVDIDDQPLRYDSYYKWLNFSDCPATRVETLTAPRVKRSRIDIFARAMGIRFVRFWRMDRRPRYFVSDDEKVFAAWFWGAHELEGKQVIGVQLHAEEVYRNYPHMEQLVRALAHDKTVLLFDGESIHGFEFPNVIKVDSLSMRKAFALAGKCDAIVAPDSSFVHLAAAFDIPCVALYGPIDGKVRTAHYPKCRYLDVRTKLGCIPCWRNDQIPCKLTNMRNSVCLQDIAVLDIVRNVNELLIRKA